jgi:hypothetical protein
LDVVEFVCECVAIKYGGRERETYQEVISIVSVRCGADTSIAVTECENEHEAVKFGVSGNEIPNLNINALTFVWKVKLTSMNELRCDVNATDAV